MVRDQRTAGMQRGEGQSRQGWGEGEVRMLGKGEFSHLNLASHSSEAAGERQPQRVPKHAFTRHPSSKMSCRTRWEVTLWV